MALFRGALGNKDAVLAFDHGCNDSSEGHHGVQRQVIGVIDLIDRGTASRPASRGRRRASDSGQHSSLRILYSDSPYPAYPHCDRHHTDVLELAFANRELRAVCEDATCAFEAFGPAADALLDRLADLRAAGHPLELPFAQARPATDNDPEHVVIDVAGLRSLVLGANHRKPPRAEDGTIAWEQVSRVIIFRLE